MPAVRRLDGQLDLFAIHRSHTQRFPFLLESRQHNPQTGRYSLLMGQAGEQRHCYAVDELPAFFAALPDPHGWDSDSRVPFIGGWFVYLSYESAWGLQPHLPALDSAPHTQPLASAVYCEQALIVDHIDNCSWSIGLEDDAVQALLNSSAANAVDTPWQPLAFRSDATEKFHAAVHQGVRYIQAGDIYQANLSRRWHGGAVASSRMLEAYARLRLRNASSFAASVQLPDLQLASASPERLFLHQHGVVETRPIAGTRPRHHDPAQDQALIRELMAHPKERAEHIMLVDLERHDLGRICAQGSVEVNELLTLESYASVHHIVSNVRGRLRNEVTATELFAALFPGGTITGCPKIRCMQIIHELEQRSRGPYTGSLGYISDCGRMDFNILIRTLVWHNGAVHVDAGAGIVADSVAELETAETEAKAGGLLRALGPLE